ncbi:MAG: GatB/YqeY domain-containing protein [Chloroflexi bacterium]|nr:MAG: GatB/YqeY domain-containing protein [Chloroflexota bacterium]
MPITETVRTEMTVAWKAGNTQRRDALRLVIAAFENARIDLGHPLTDEDATSVLQKEAKQRRDSITEFAAAGRADLVAKEQGELDAIIDFLPQQMSEEELRAIVQSVIDEAGATSAADLGKVMRPLMARLAGRADGGAANVIAKDILAGS